MNNLFSDIPAGLENELFETLASSEKVVVERIVSTCLLYTSDAADDNRLVWMSGVAGGV